MTQQLALDGMPEPLYAASPARLSTYADCPRRYRLGYLDRPAPVRGPAWAHTSVGAAVHNALAKWWDLPRARRTARGRGSPARQRLADRRLPRRAAAGGRPRALARAGRALPRRRRPRRPADRGRADRRRHDAAGLAVGPGRPHRPARRGHRRGRLQDRPLRAHPRRRAHLGRPRGVRRRGGPHAAPRLHPGRAAPPAHRRRPGLGPHRGIARATTSRAPTPSRPSSTSSTTGSAPGCRRPRPTSCSRRASGPGAAGATSGRPAGRASRSRGVSPGPGWSRTARPSGSRPR